MSEPPARRVQVWHQPSQGFPGTGGGGSSGLGNSVVFTGTGSDLLINGTVSAVPEPSSYAAVFGALTVGRRILWIQGLPAAVVLLLDRLVRG